MNGVKILQSAVLKCIISYKRVIFFVFFSKKLQKLVIIESGLVLLLVDYYIHTEFQRVLSDAFWHAYLYKWLKYNMLGYYYRITNYFRFE